MTFWTETYPVARKEHRCTLCGRTIRPGETYRRGVGLDDGRAWTFKECAHCRAVMDLCDPAWGEYEYDADVLYEWEPQDIREARWRAQHRRKWMRRDGSLYPIPAGVGRVMTLIEGSA
jgi:hypothetical protein